MHCDSCRVRLPDIMFDIRSYLKVRSLRSIPLASQDRTFRNSKQCSTVDMSIVHHGTHARAFSQRLVHSRKVYAGKMGGGDAMAI